MNKKVALAFFLGALLASTIAYAMSVTPWCYFSASGVCTAVTAATPLPTYMPLGY